ncbi:MAG: porin family protein [Bacteroidia bacterium]
MDAFYKKIILVYLLILASAPFVLEAQQAQPRFRAGISGGITDSNIGGTHLYRGRHFRKAGITAGAIVNTRLDEKNTLQFEMNFTQKGSLQPPDSNNYGYFKIALNYVEVPIMIKHHMRFTMFKKLRENYDFEAGVSYGKLIRSTVVGEANYAISGASRSFNPNDISLLFGLDYNFSENYYFCLRYTNSIVPAIRRNAFNYSVIRYTFNNGNNMSFQLSLKYLFGGNKVADNAPILTQ